MDDRQSHPAKSHAAHGEPDGLGPYGLLAAMAIIHFAIMYAVMYAMVDVFANVYNNLNQVYMAGMMTAPMILLEVIMMRRMYSRRAINIAVVAVSALMLVLLFVFMRQQTAIGDVQFLRSMIPHHAGAILMCEQASLSEPSIMELCQSIIASQQEEIAQMKAMLADLRR